MVLVYPPDTGHGTPRTRSTWTFNGSRGCKILTLSLPVYPVIVRDQLCLSLRTFLKEGKGRRWDEKKKGKCSYSTTRYPSYDPNRPNICPTQLSFFKVGPSLDSVGEHLETDETTSLGPLKLGKCTGSPPRDVHGNQTLNDQVSVTEVDRDEETQRSLREICMTIGDDRTSWDPRRTQTKSYLTEGV